MDRRIKHLSNCKYTTYNCTQVNYELEYVLLLIRVQHWNLLDRVVEHNDWLSWTEVCFLWYFQLEYFGVKQESKCTLEYWWDCIDKEWCLHALSSFFSWHYALSHNFNLCLLCISIKLIKRVLYVSSRKALTNLVEVCFFPKWKMVDLEGVVKIETFHTHLHYNVLEISCSNIKITRDTIQFNVTFKSTSLLILKFLKSTVSYCSSCLCLLNPSFNTEINPRSTNPMLVEFAIVVINLVVKRVSQVQPNDIARDIWKSYI